MPAEKTKELTKSVLVAIPMSLLNQLDIAATALRYPRTQIIVRSLRRDLHTTLRQEVFKARQHDQAMKESFGTW